MGKVIVVSGAQLVVHGGSEKSAYLDAANS